MKSLFFLILSLVFVLVNLIAPNLFNYNMSSYLPVKTEAAVVVAEEEVLINRII